HADRRREIKADDHLTVASNQHVKLGQGQFIEAEQEIHLSSGTKVVLEAGAVIAFKVGGSFVKRDPGGVTLAGPSVKMQSSGRAGQGSGARPLVPGETGASEVADKGKLLVQAQRQALMRAAPRCDICLQPEQPALAREGTGQ